MLNQKKDLERVLNTGFKKEDPTFNELLVLAKHYRQEGYGKDKIKNKIIEFCRDRDARFDGTNFLSIINRVSLLAIENKELIEPRKVRVYQDELAKIEKAKDFKTRTILFSMLVLAKAQFNRNIISGNDDTYFLLNSGTKIYKNQFKKMLKGLSDFFEIRIGYGNTYYYYLKFVSDSDSLKCVRVLEEEEVEKSGEIYREIVGGDELCVDCEMVIQRESNRHKRCKNCQKEEGNKKVKRFREKNK